MDDLLSIRELSEKWHVSTRTLRRYVSQGRVRAVRYRVANCGLRAEKWNALKSHAGARFGRISRAQESETHGRFITTIVDSSPSSIRSMRRSVASSFSSCQNLAVSRCSST